MFESQAVELLSLYFAENKESTADIIRAGIPLWGNKSLLTLAANAGSKDFVAHISCQRYLDDLWLGKVRTFFNNCYEMRIPQMIK